MKSSPKNEKRVLAIDPTVKGFGYVVFEGPERLIDWSNVHVGLPRHEKCLVRVTALLESFTPAVVVLEDPNSRRTRRGTRVQRLIKGILELAWRRDIKTNCYSMDQVRKTFEENRDMTKEQIAAMLVARYGELAPRLPPHRRPWMSKDERMGIFGAAALALTYYQFPQKGRSKSIR